MIAISFSTDWAPAPVLQYTLDILDEYGVPATFFCTDDLTQDTFPRSQVKHELGIHPNFHLACCYDTVVRKMKRKFPDAAGSRSHRFMTGTPIIRALHESGIQYDSSVPTYYNHVEPYMQLYNVLQIPVWFSDDIALRGGHIPGFAERFPRQYFLMDSSDTLVLNFHPVHVYLNTIRHETYETAKGHYKDPDRLRQYRESGDGVESALRAVLSRRTTFVTLSDIADRVTEDWEESP